MPSKRTFRSRKRQPGADLTAEIRTILRLGEDMCGLFRDLTPEEFEVKLRELCELYSAEVLEFHIAHEPLTRPACWWKFDSPAPRSEVVFTDSSDGYAGDRALQHAKELKILVRHGLLTPEERAILATKPGADTWMISTGGASCMALKTPAANAYGSTSVARAVIWPISSSDASAVNHRAVYTRLRSLR